MGFFKTISASILAILLLFASTGVVLQKHYCMGELQEVAFFSKATSCVDHQVVELPPCHRPHQQSKESKGCCEDNTEYIHSDDYTQPAQISLDHSSPLVVLFAYTLPTDLFSADSNPDHGSYLVHRPPDLNADITVTHQVFRL